MVPTLIRASLDRGQGGMVGLGKNKWPNVDVDDGNVSLGLETLIFEIQNWRIILIVADLYIVLFDKIRADINGVPHGREGFYFGASGENDLYEVGKAIAQALVEVGRAKDAEPTSFTKEEIDKYFGGVSLPIFIVCLRDFLPLLIYY